MGDGVNRVRPYDVVGEVRILSNKITALQNEMKELKSVLANSLDCIKRLHEAEIEARKQDIMRDMNTPMAPMETTTSDNTEYLSNQMINRYFEKRGR